MTEDESRKPERELYTTKEVAIILGIQMNSVGLYYKKFNIGQKYGRDLLFSASDIEEIRNTDGRKKK